ncbi:MAG TPA: hypothetical protein VGC08_10935 [Pedobacter sp.]
MKKVTLIFICLFLSLGVTFGQSVKEVPSKEMADSIKMVYLSAAAIGYPILRQGFVSTDILGNGNIDAKLHGNEFFKAKASNTRVRSLFNIPLKEWGNNNITATLTYDQEHYNLTSVTSFNPQIPVSNTNFNKSTVGFTATYVHTDSLFNHQVIYSASISGLTDQLSSIERIYYTGTVTFPLKRTATTAYMVGAAVTIDRSSQFPFLPFFSYWHKFKTQDLELFADLPSRVSLRKQLSSKSWLSLNTDLTGTFLFFDLNHPLPQEANYSKIELKTGPSFEYLLTKKLILGVNGGMISTLSSRMFQRSEGSGDYFINSNNSTVPYVNFTISFLPFLKAIR